MGEQLDNYNMETDYEYFPLLCQLAAQQKAKDYVETFFPTTTAVYIQRLEGSY